MLETSGELSRAASRWIAPPVTCRALAAAKARVNPVPPGGLAGRVVAKLLRGQFEADEVLEGRLGDSVANARIVHRVDRGVGIADLARLGQDFPDIVGKRRGGPRNARGPRP